ncbi:hypothetical protein TUBRATIS_31300, partial [Tubulinosema ratisbonensis]
MIEILHEHNHTTEEAKIKKILALNLIKERSNNTKELSFDIITTVSSRLDQETIRNMPKYKSLVEKINRIRNKKNETFLAKFDDIPEDFRSNFRKEPFLRYDSGYNDPERTIVFFTDSSLKYLSSARCWVIDGTFKSVPKDFLQLITIHGVVFEKTLPLAYILLKSKTESTYIHCFNILKKQTLKSPKYIILDFEKALINSIKNVFTDSKVNLCLFHFGQSVWR